MARDNSQHFLERRAEGIPMVTAAAVRGLDLAGWTVLCGDLEKGFTAFHFTDEGEAQDFAEWAAGRLEGADTFDVVGTYSSIETRDAWDDLARKWLQEPAEEVPNR